MTIALGGIFCVLIVWILRDFLRAPVQLIRTDDGGDNGMRRTFTEVFSSRRETPWWLHIILEFIPSKEVINPANNEICEYKVFRGGIYGFIATGWITMSQRDYDEAFGIR